MDQQDTQDMPVVATIPSSNGTSNGTYGKMSAPKNFKFICFVLFAIVNLILLLYVSNNSNSEDTIVTSSNNSGTTTIVHWTLYLLGVMFTLFSWLMFYSYAHSDKKRYVAVPFVLGGLCLWASIIQKQYSGHFTGSSIDIGIHVIQLAHLLLGGLCIYLA